MLRHAGEHLQTEHTFEDAQVGKFQDGMTGLVHKIGHTYLIFVLSFVQKFFQVVAASRLVAFEKRKEFVHARRNLHDIFLAKKNGVRRVQTLELVIIGGFFAKMIKKLFKHIGHPVPAGAHIKHKTVGSVLAGTTARHTVFF